MNNDSKYTMGSVRQLLIAAMMTAGVMTGVAHASPEGGDVIEGDADIDYGDWTRVVTGEITIIQWLSFQIAAGETVEFIMPSETSRVLNLINSGVPTEIMGTILGNGQVFLVNPSGVIFGQGAVVNVGALYAAAGNISKSDFVDGVYRFTDARGIVENRGLLQGDLISLIGGRVANHGTISAPGGTVIMAAGEQVLIGEHFGHVFVQLEKPSDLANTDLLGPIEGYPDGDFENGVDLAAGDVFSLAAWNTGTIEASHTTIAVSAGYSAIDSDLSAGDITLIADGDSYINLGADLAADGSGIFIEGDLVLTDDVSMSLTNTANVMAFKGSVDSAAGAENDLRISAGSGLVSFRDGVGQTNRLGVFDVSGGQIQFFDDVAVNQEMNFYGPVAIMRNSTTFDVGFGTALFADNLFSFRDGFSDVSFVYDGQAWVGNGEARTPFKFRAGIGVNHSVNRGFSEGAFGNIRFGGDLSDPSRVSAFMFGTGAMAGLELIDSATTSLDIGFTVMARESIVMGQGQKMLSFGSLALIADSFYGQPLGDGPSTLVEIGDINVLGDLLVISRGYNGGYIHLLDRAAGEIDYIGNEDNRTGEGVFDLGMELIASGSITLDGSLISGDETVSLVGSNVLILNNAGDGAAGGLEIGLYDGGVSLDLFRGQLAGTDAMLYPYDLTQFSMLTQSPSAELATALVQDGSITLRSDDPIAPATQILTELSMNPFDPSLDTIRKGLNDGLLRHVSVDPADQKVAIDRLTVSSVARLTDAYVGLLGNLDRDVNTRVRLVEVTDAIESLAMGFDAQEFGSVFDYATEHDALGMAVLNQIEDVLGAIDLLELTPLEINRAKTALLSLVKPDGLSMESFVGWFNSPTAQVVSR